MAFCSWLNFLTARGTKIFTVIRPNLRGLMGGEFFLGTVDNNLVGGIMVCIYIYILYIYIHIYLYTYILYIYILYIYICIYIHAKLLFEIHHRIYRGKSRNYRDISWDISWEYVPTNWSLTLWMDLGLEIIGDTIQVVTELVARLLAGDFPMMICLWVRKHQLTVTFSPTWCYTTWLGVGLCDLFFLADFCHWPKLTLW